MGKRTPISTTALYQEVAARLRERIYSRDLNPGDAIDELALAEEYGVSRTPMREALKVLHAEGLVVLEPRRGCHVTQLTEKDIEELFPVMALLEGRCAYEAVKKSKQGDIKKIEDLHRKLEKFAEMGAVEKYFEHNCFLHEFIQNLAGNSWLEKTTCDLRKFLRLMRGRQLHLPGRLESSLNEHRMLLAAFKKGDPSEAERIMNEHLTNQRTALKKYDSANNSIVWKGKEGQARSA